MGGQEGTERRQGAKQETPLSQRGPGMPLVSEGLLFPGLGLVLSPEKLNLYPQWLAPQGTEGPHGTGPIKSMVPHVETDGIRES